MRSISSPHYVVSRPRVRQTETVSCEVNSTEESYSQTKPTRQLTKQEQRRITVIFSVNIGFLDHLGLIHSERSPVICVNCVIGLRVTKIRPWNITLRNPQDFVDFRPVDESMWIRSNAENVDAVAFYPPRGGRKSSGVSWNLFRGKSRRSKWYGILHRRWKKGKNVMYIYS